MAERRTPNPDAGGSTPSWPVFNYYYGVMMQKIIIYLEHVVDETKKVHWPSWEELKGSTWAVVIVTIVLAAVIFSFDKVMTFLLGVVFK